MKKLFVLALIIGFFVTPTLVRAEGYESAPMEKMAETNTTTDNASDDTKMVEVGNKICPVSGEKVEGKMGKGVPYAYNGKIYMMCCGMCNKDFDKDPAKYAKIAEDEVAASAKDQKTN